MSCVEPTQMVGSCVLFLAEEAGARLSSSDWGNQLSSQTFTVNSLLYYFIHVLLSKRDLLVTRWWMANINSNMAVMTRQSQKNLPDLTLKPPEVSRETLKCFTARLFFKYKVCIPCVQPLVELIRTDVQSWAHGPTLDWINRCTALQCVRPGQAKPSQAKLS